MFSFLRRLLTSPEPVPASIYDFKVTSVDGGIIDFSAFRGRKILIVNTASYCGFTPQYAGLESLYQQHKDKLVVVGFPCNNFMFQEPGTNKMIADFCSRNYNVTFPMAAKISVKGRLKAPIYRWLTEKRYNGYGDSEVKWNFQKYLINEQGKLTHIFSHKASPLEKEIVDVICDR